MPATKTRCGLVAPLLLEFDRGHLILRGHVNTSWDRKFRSGCELSCDICRWIRRDWIGHVVSEKKLAELLSDKTLKLQWPALFLILLERYGCFSYFLHVAADLLNKTNSWSFIWWRSWYLNSADAWFVNMINNRQVVNGMVVRHVAIKICKHRIMLPLILICEVCNLGNPRMWMITVVSYCYAW